MLTIRNLRKRYGELAVLERLDLEVGDGEIVAIVGPSGCGKSTLLNIIAGIVPSDGGTVDAGGARLGYVFQEDRLLPWRTAAENIRLVRERPDPDGLARLIDLVGLAGFESYYPDALSGGMRQRCAIARACHYDCDLLLMDEPFKSLDHNLRFEMLEILMRMRGEKRTTVLFVTHDIDEALAIATRVVALGKRPAAVLGEFRLGDAGGVRDTSARELLAVKNEVIRTLA